MVNDSNDVIDENDVIAIVAASRLRHGHRRNRRVDLGLRPLTVSFPALASASRSGLSGHFNPHAGTEVSRKTHGACPCRCSFSRTMSAR